jgi:hypothetical protein
MLSSSLRDEMGLTVREIEVLKFICDFRELGISPTYREIATHFGFVSTEQVLRVTAKLKRLGLLSDDQRLAAMARNLLPTNLARSVVIEYEQAHLE